MREKRIWLKNNTNKVTYCSCFLLRHDGGGARLATIGFVSTIMPAPEACCVIWPSWGWLVVVEEQQEVGDLWAVRIFVGDRSLIAVLELVKPSIRSASWDSSLDLKGDGRDRKDMWTATPEVASSLLLCCL